MLQAIKKQICLQKSDWLLGTGCELVMWLIGIAFMLVMQRSDPEDTYVLLGTIFAIIGSAGVAHSLWRMDSGLILTRRFLLETDELRFLFPIILHGWQAFSCTSESCFWYRKESMQCMHPSGSERQ